jgi:hypothetical protein
MLLRVGERARPSEPSIRRYVVPAFRRAIVECFGDEGRQQTIALLEGDAREEFLREVATNLDWFPARHLVAWGFAVWEGPARRDRAAMSAFVRRQWDLSHGVVRRLLLHLAAPHSIVPRLAAIWQEDNVGGTCTATLDEGGHGASIELRDTVWAETPHGRASLAEVYRHAFAQTRAHDVTETHAPDGARNMVIRLKWR